MLSTIRCSYWHPPRRPSLAPTAPALASGAYPSPVVRLARDPWRERELHLPPLRHKPPRPSTAGSVLHPDACDPGKPFPSSQASTAAHVVPGSSPLRCSICAWRILAGARTNHPIAPCQGWTASCSMVGRILHHLKASCQLPAHPKTSIGVRKSFHPCEALHQDGSRCHRVRQFLLRPGRLMQ